MMKALPISVLTVKTDPYGRFVILVIKVWNTPLTLVYIYVPPPFSLTHLDDMLQVTLSVAEEKIFIMGDFNAVAEPSLDWRTGSSSSPVPFAVWLSIYVFQDVWRHKLPDLREYSCYSEMHKPSRIDTVLAEGAGLELVELVQY